MDPEERQTKFFVPAADCFFSCLLVVLLGLVVNDVVELELINTLGGGDDAEPVAELHLLEELLGPGSARLSAAGGLSRGGRLREERALQVLEVAAREVIVGNDLDLALALLGDLDGVAKVANAAVDLDLLVQEFLEGRDIEDLVARRLRGVDDELHGEHIIYQRPTRQTTALSRIMDSPSWLSWGPSWRQTSSVAPEGKILT